MITDPLHNPTVLVLRPLVVAFFCATVLAATRRWLPPTNRRWRLARALFIVACIIGGLAATYSFAGWRASILSMPPLSHVPLRLLGMVSMILGEAVFIGWLIPTMIERRSLQEMGWVRKRLAIYVLVFIAVGAGIALLKLLVPSTHEAPVREIFPGFGTPQAVLWANVELILWGVVRQFLAVAWTEENLFRGHLLATLKENKLSGKWANIVQSLVFASVHVPALVAGVSGHSAGVGRTSAAVIGRLIGVTLLGLLYGWLRLRTGSIVPSFVVHGTANVLMRLSQWGALYSRIARMMG